MDIMIIPAWIDMAGAVSPLFFFGFWDETSPFPDFFFGAGFQI